MVYTRKKLKHLQHLNFPWWVTEVSEDFTPANITPTTNQVFSNPSTLTHTTHSSYTVESEFNCLDDKFYYDSDIDWIFDSGATKHICWNHGAFTNFRAINKTIIPVNLLSVRCIKTHSNYITTKDGYQIVNRKSGEVVMEGVSIGKMYTLKHKHSLQRHYRRH
jgi:hypothetical protein